MTHSDIFGWLAVFVVFVGSFYAFWWSNFSAAAEKADAKAARGLGEFAGRMVAGAVRDATRR